MRSRTHSNYQVLDWPKGLDVRIDEIWRAFPDLVLGRFLVNTSFDSGRFMPSEAEIAQGWHVVGQLAHSPAISAIEQIPHDQFDEWLVFDRPVQVYTFETLVNYCEFSPLDFDWEEKIQPFWQQIAELQPLHLFGENYGTYLVTRDEDLAKRIQGSRTIGSSQPP